MNSASRNAVKSGKSSRKENSGLVLSRFFKKSAEAVADGRKQRDELVQKLKEMRERKSVPPLTQLDVNQSGTVSSVTDSGISTPRMSMTEWDDFQKNAKDLLCSATVTCANDPVTMFSDNDIPPLSAVSQLNTIGRASSTTGTPARMKIERKGMPKVDCIHKSTKKKPRQKMPRYQTAAFRKWRIKPVDWKYPPGYVQSKFKELFRPLLDRMNAPQYRITDFREPTQSADTLPTNVEIRSGVNNCSSTAPAPVTLSVNNEVDTVCETPSAESFENCVSPVPTISPPKQIDQFNDGFDESLFHVVGSTDSVSFAPKNDYLFDVDFPDSLFESI